jgi:hypothetical protein
MLAGQGEERKGKMFDERIGCLVYAGREMKIWQSTSPCSRKVVKCCLRRRVLRRMQRRGGAGWFAFGQK